MVLIFLVTSQACGTYEGGACLKKSFIEKNIYITNMIAVIAAWNIEMFSLRNTGKLQINR